ncbi:MAG: hypothetical protein L3J75_17735 [Methylococcaceae bacterium]|nr:hypothetical protein [Methylococcaceae bacterium]
MLKYIFIVLTLLVCLFIGWYFSLVFNESLYFQKNSLKYYMLIPDELREIPLFNNKEEAYYYSSGDGATTGRTAVSYNSILEKDKIIEKYSLYFKKQKGTLNMTENGSIKFKFPEKKGIMKIEIKKDAPGNKVTIENFSE